MAFGNYQEVALLLLFTTCYCTAQSGPNFLVAAPSVLQIGVKQTVVVSVFKVNTPISVAVRVEDRNGQTLYQAANQNVKKHKRQVHDDKSSAVTSPIKCEYCQPGIRGPRGVAGPRGAVGPRGPAGPRGPPGAPAMFRNLRCDARNEGAVRYNSNANKLQYCNTYHWVAVSPSALSSDHSCVDVYQANKEATSGIYWVKPSAAMPAFKVFCDFHGGWTLVMKINGNKQTFNYDSSFWTNKVTYNTGHLALDGNEAKFDSYWTMPFKEVRLGMRVGSSINWISFSYSGTSLYDVIKDGKFRRIDIGRSTWLSLIPRSSLQTHCDRQGFNANVNLKRERVRIGILGNNEDSCGTPDSFLGFGGRSKLGNVVNSCGNYVRCCVAKYERVLNVKAMGYIMIR